LTKKGKEEEGFLWLLNEIVLIEKAKEERNSQFVIYCLKKLLS